MRAYYTRHTTITVFLITPISDFDLRIQAQKLINMYVCVSYTLKYAPK